MLRILLVCLLVFVGFAAEKTVSANTLAPPALRDTIDGYQPVETVVRQSGGHLLVAAGVPYSGKWRAKVLTRTGFELGDELIGATLFLDVNTTSGECIHCHIVEEWRGRMANATFAFWEYVSVARGAILPSVDADNNAAEDIVSQVVDTEGVFVFRAQIPRLPQSIAYAAVWMQEEGYEERPEWMIANWEERETFEAMGDDGGAGNWSFCAVDTTLIPDTFEDIGAGDSYVCSLTYFGVVRCFSNKNSASTPLLGNPTIKKKVGMRHPPNSIPPVPINNVARLAVGDFHCLALLRNGSVVGWGKNHFGQVGVGLDATYVGWPTLVESLEAPHDDPVVQLEGGWYLSCALFASGRIKCAGRGDWGMLGTGSTDDTNVFGDYVTIDEPAVAVRVGSYHSGALLRDGKLHFWGYCGCGECGDVGRNELGDDERVDSVGYANVPTYSPVVMFDVHNQYSMISMQDGTVIVFGRVEDGLSGHPEITETCFGFLSGELDNADPIDVGGPVIGIAAGGDYACVILAPTLALNCWGNGYEGQLGRGNIADIGDDETPASEGDVDLGGKVLRLGLGYLSTCVILGDSLSIRILGDEPVGLELENIGDKETIASLYPEGQLAIGVSPSGIGTLALPPAASSPLTMRQAFTGNTGALIPLAGVAAGPYITCFLSNRGQLKAAGRNVDGVLGNGDEDIGDNEYLTSIPPIKFGRPVVRVGVGGKHLCVLLDNGKVRCLGRGLSGQNGSPSHSSITIGDDEYVDLGGEKARDVCCGASFTCLVMANDTLRCFGRNARGQLGLGHTDPMPYSSPAALPPVRIGGAVERIACGAEHVLVLLRNGSVRAFGRGDQGRLGLQVGDVGDDEHPEEIPPLDTGSLPRVIDIAAGGGTSCFLFADRSTRCIGRNLRGMLGAPWAGLQTILGDATYPLASLPAIQWGGPVRQIVVGLEHECVVVEEPDGWVKCVGKSLSGQTGQGNTKPISDPTTVPFVWVGGVVESLAAGGWHNAALLRDGQARTWGYGGSGATGLGFTTHIGNGEPVASANPVPLGFHSTPTSFPSNIHLASHDRTGIPWLPSASPPLLLYLPPSLLPPSYLGEVYAITLPDMIAPLPSSITFKPDSLTIDTVPPESIASLCPLPPTTIAKSSVCRHIEPQGLLSSGSFSPRHSVHITHISTPHILLPTTGGTTVTVYGTGFDTVIASGGVQSVEIGDVDCTNARFSSDSASFSCVTAPGSGANLSISITPQAPSLLSTITAAPAVQLSFTPPSVVATSIPPVSLSPGDSISILGSGFGPTGGIATVMFDSDGECGNVVVENDGRITCNAPSNVATASFLTVEVNSQVSVPLTLSLPPSQAPIALVAFRRVGVEDAMVVAWLHRETSGAAAIATDFEIFILDTEETVSVASSRALAAGNALAFLPFTSLYSAFATTITGIPPYPVRVRIRALNGQGVPGPWSVVTERIPASCPKGEVLLDVVGLNSTKAVCVQCPEGGVCAERSATSLSETSVAQSDGFWKLPWVPGGIGFSTCFVDGACVEQKVVHPSVDVEEVAFNTSDSWVGREPSQSEKKGRLSSEVRGASCRKGHEGRLCGKCSRGYSRGSEGLCEKCPSSGLIIAGLLGWGLVIAILYAFFLVRNILTADTFDDQQRGAVFKVLLKHFQVVTLVLSLIRETQFHSSTTTFFSWMRAFSFLGTNGFTLLDCALPYAIRNSPFVDVVLAVAIVPVALALYAAVFWAAWPHTCGRCVHWMGRRKLVRQNSRLVNQSVGWWSRMQLSLLIEVFILQPVFANAGFLLLGRAEVKPASLPAALGHPSAYVKMVLISFSHIDADDPTIIAIGTLVTCLALAIPMSIAVFLYCNRSRLHDRDFARKAGFFYHDFDDAAYLWEPLVMVFTIIRVATTIGLAAEDAGSQFAAVAAVEITLVALQGYVNPFRNDNLDTLALAANYVASLTYVAGSLVAAGVATTQLSIAVLLINSAILIAAAILAWNPTCEVRRSCASRTPTIEPKAPTEKAEVTIA